MEKEKTPLIANIIAVLIVVGIGYMLISPSSVKKQLLTLPEFDKSLATNGILQSTEYLEKTKGKKKELEVFVSFKTPVLNTGREGDTLSKIKNKFAKDYKKIKVALVHDTSGSYMTKDFELKDGNFVQIK